MVKRKDAAQERMASLSLDRLLSDLTIIKEYGKAEMELSAFRIARETGWSREKVLETLLTKPLMTGFPTLRLQDSDPFNFMVLATHLRAANIVIQDVQHYRKMAARHGDISKGELR